MPDLRKLYEFSNGMPAIDSITQKHIPRQYAIRLGGQWYDTRALKKWANQRERNGLAPTLPHTGLPMNKNQRAALHRRTYVRPSTWSYVKRGVKNLMAPLSVNINEARPNRRYPVASDFS